MRSIVQFLDGAVENCLIEQWALVCRIAALPPAVASADREVLYYQWTNWLILARSYNATAVVCTIVWIVNISVLDQRSH